ncbi:hypothetical protein Hypma_009611 [Hypsizygus marmoreus]|uniref:WKF domain-containing protein n=1 Tax=Hypsizygus marmoreus TaxID=39966 RepID=A0A369JRK9_HYPMA|nr:hypothetical protein Hypma_009611 [Hypsizygus marmoreus]
MAHSIALAHSDPDVSAKKKKVKTLRKDEEAIISHAEANLKKSKKRTNEHVDNVMDVDGDEATAKKEEEKKRKRKREMDSSEAVSDHDAVDKDSRKKKKKRSKGSHAAKEPEVDTSTDLPEKKKRKNKTGFQDPNEDTSLVEQAQKSLAYAFLQFHRPSKWKFNKARQNWLIRNIWSAETIPEAYLPLVMAYLAKVQGGVRENLIQSCRAALEPPKLEIPQAELETADTAEPAPPPLPAPVKSLENDKTKLSRAQALLDILNSPQTMDN